MPRFEITTALAASPQSVFDVCLDVDAHTRSMAASQEQAVAQTTAGRLSLGDTVTFNARHFGLHWRLTARITSYDPPWHFTDEQVAGPFKRWSHTHYFTPDGTGGTVMRDVIDFASPFGILGAFVDRSVIGWYMQKLITTRNAYLAAAMRS